MYRSSYAILYYCVTCWVVAGSEGGSRKEVTLPTSRKRRSREGDSPDLNICCNGARDRIGMAAQAFASHQKSLLSI